MDSLVPLCRDLADFDGHMDLCKLSGPEHSYYCFEVGGDIEDLGGVCIVTWLECFHFQMMVRADGKLLHGDRPLLVEVDIEIRLVREYFLEYTDPVHPEVLGTVTWMAER